MFRWLKGKARKSPRRESPELPKVSTHDDAPPGETDTIVRINHLCWKGRMSAKSVAEDRASGKPIEE